jgi:hypothetical protein
LQHLSNFGELSVQQQSVQRPEDELELSGGKQVSGLFGMPMRLAELYPGE